MCKALKIGTDGLPAEIAAAESTDLVVAVSGPNKILGRTSSGAGGHEEIDVSALTEKTTPAAGDWLLGSTSAGALRKFNVGNLPSGGGGGNAVQKMKWVGYIRPFPNSSGADVFGLVVSSSSPFQRTPTTANRYMVLPKLGFRNTTGSGTIGGVRGHATHFVVGQGTFGGFELRVHFGVQNGNSNSIGFVGLRDTSAFPSLSTNPSTLTNIIGVGWDNGQTTMRVMHNDASGTATMIDLGASFPNDVYETHIFDLKITANVDGTVLVSITNTSTDTTVEHTLTTDLPSVFLCPILWVSANSGTTTAIDLFNLEIEP